MPGSHSRRLSALAALIGALASPLAVGQTPPADAAPTTAPQTTTAAPQPATAAKPEAKLVSEFTDLAGSKENAAALVSGLRSGSAISLGTSAPGAGGAAAGGAATTFTAPTKPMGYGNVRIALSLARAQLASQGVTNPTAAELQGALVGTAGTNGTGTQAGILQMRADGMGWGKIANTMGFKLGAVMSGKQALPAAGAASSTGLSSGVTTAAGSSSGTVTAAGNSGKHGSITTAAGGNVRGSGITTGMGQSHGGGMAYASAGRGAVNAAGGQAGSMAGGSGHGNGGKH